jgi:putative aldouronate transport system substrate-binding protein
LRSFSRFDNFILNFRKIQTLKEDYNMNSLGRNIAIAFWVVTLLTLLSGCKKDGMAGTASNYSETQKLKKDTKLTWYVRGTGAENLEGMKELQRRTGVTIVYQQADTNADEQFKLMIASGSYPDIIQWKLHSKTMDIPKYYKEGVIIKLNDLIDKHTPNFKKILDYQPDIKKEIMTDDGTIAFFPSINPMETVEDKRQSATTGFVIRKDWLDRLGLKVPTSIDEWYVALKAFKEMDPNGDGAANEIPFDGTGINMFAPAWGIRTTFYRNPKTDKVSYGPLEPEFKNYLATMNKWYSDGLLGRNTILQDTRVTDINIRSNVAGSFKSLDNAWEKYLGDIKKINPTASLIAVPWPKGPAGKAYTDRTELISYVNAETTSITSQCKHPEEAAEFLDFFYSKEGNDLINWGILGKSYTIENGIKKFIPEILNNSDPTQGLGLYAKYWSAVPKYGTGGAEISRLTPEKINAQDTWLQSDTSLLLPPSLSFTEEESAKLNEINTDIVVYFTDIFNQFVTGAEPLSNYDSYIQTLKKMKIDEAIKIYQNSYERYKSRK